MEPQVEARQSKVTARWTFLSLHLYLSINETKLPTCFSRDTDLSFSDGICKGNKFCCAEFIKKLFASIPFVLAEHF